jgi:thioredoxin reductase (NADPH)
MPDSSVKIEDLLIIGSGPAGLTAAIYGARADLKPLVLAGAAYGGQLMLTTEVENFPGFPAGIMGPQLMTNILEQAKRFGAEVVFKDATRVELDTENRENPVHKVWAGDQEYRARAIIIATGAKPRKLAVPGETEFWGKGVSSCATCDGAFYRGKVVAVVGGGDSAMEEANFLTRFAEKVYVIHRRNEFRASKIMQQRAENNPKVTFVVSTVITEITGELTVNGLKLQNTETQEESELAVDGLFLAIGYIPETEMFSKYIDVNSQGYAVPVKRTMSKVEGVFIAGDVEDDHYRQAVTAAADGCKAALDAEKWLMERD